MVDGNVRVAAPLVMDEITGAVKVLFVRVCVAVFVVTSTPSIVTTPAPDLAIVVSDA